MHTCEAEDDRGGDGDSLVEMNASIVAFRSRTWCRGSLWWGIKAATAIHKGNDAAQGVDDSAMALQRNRRTHREGSPPATQLVSFEYARMKQRQTQKSNTDKQPTERKRQIRTASTRSTKAKKNSQTKSNHRKWSSLHTHLRRCREIGN